jgi:hypothetical protein
MLSMAGCATQEVSPLGDADLWEDGRTLSLSIPSCNAEEITAEVDETDTAVTITVSATNPDDGSECLDSTIIELDEPLGSRTLIDGIDRRRNYGQTPIRGRYFAKLDARLPAISPP